MRTRATLGGGLALAFLFSQSLVPAAHAAATVVAWGANDSGQVSPLPAGLNNVVSVAAGVSHSVALRGDGTVVAWGYNSSGQTNVPQGLTSVAAIAAGSTYSLALQSNGTVVVWGSQTQAPASATNVTAIAAGWYHSLALRSDGTVVSWGAQTDVPGDLSNVVAIAAGNGQSLALRLDGSVVAWGDSSFNKTIVPAAASSNVVWIAAGADHCLALQRSGRVLAWGRNDNGQTNVPVDLTNAVAVSGGALHSLALRANGILVAWGSNSDGQSVTSTNDPGYISISAGGFHNLALKGDGTPYILVPPVSQTVMISKSATLQVLAVGAQPLRFQWYHYGTNLFGATNATLTIANVQARDGGPYTVSVGNTFNTIFSPPATLTALGVPPFVTVPPHDTSALCGDSATFSVTVDGSSPFTYQWQFQGGPLPGATRSALTLAVVDLNSAGTYYVAVSNAFGGVVTGAVLTVIPQAPLITSSLAAVGLQGQPFSYKITAQHTPIQFGAQFLPAGLSVNTNTGVISGTPAESGIFGVVITAINACASDTKTLMLTLQSGAPVILSSTNATGVEELPFSYQILASGSPTSFGAQNLPAGLTVDAVSGQISGTPTFAGSFAATIWATNVWGAGSAPLYFTISNMPILNLNIGGVTYTYSKPYLLDFQFSLYTVLGDPTDPTAPVTGVVVDPHLLSATCMEDGITNSATETGSFLVKGNKKVVKAYLVLDFTESIASLVNGDANTNGISDAVDFEIAGAQAFVNQQPPDVQVGVYEFHRDDWAPSNVVALTSDKVLLNNSISGIWTNYVHNYSTGSRCWDALAMAINGLGAKNADEQHFIVFISDGRDESSTNTLNGVIALATNAAVKIYAIGFGSELLPANLQAIAAATQGSYYPATTPADIAAKLGQISKDSQGQYILRWATLKRKATPFMPSFLISYAGLTAASPTNPVTDAVTNIDNSTTPPTTNITPAITNFIIGLYFPNSNAGPVSVGALRTVVNAEVQPTAIDLRTTYTPPHITQFRFRYIPNWPCTPILQSTNPGDILYNWTMTQTNDSAGTNYLLLSSPGPTVEVPFTAFDKLVRFQFNDVINPSNAFAVLSVDTNLAAYTGGQSFILSNQFLQFYPTLPYGTPVPWLIAYGYTPGTSNTWAAAELADKDGDGMLNWQEYRANTDPTSALSKLVVNSVGRLADGRFQINFTTSTNRSYRLDASTDLATWQVVQDNIPGINANVTIIDGRFLPGVTTIYYRVAVH